LILKQLKSEHWYEFAAQIFIFATITSSPKNSGQTSIY